MANKTSAFNYAGGVSENDIFTELAKDILIESVTVNTGNDQNFIRYKATNTSSNMAGEEKIFLLGITEKNKTDIIDQSSNDGFSLLHHKMFKLDPIQSPSNDYNFSGTFNGNPISYKKYNLSLVGLKNDFTPVEIQKKPVVVYTLDDKIFTSPEYIDGVVIPESGKYSVTFNKPKNYSEMCHFLFDWYRDEKSLNPYGETQDDIKRRLEEEYDSIIINEKLYYVPWLGIRPGHGEAQNLDLAVEKRFVSLTLQLINNTNSKILENDILEFVSSDPNGIKVSIPDVKLKDRGGYEDIHKIKANKVDKKIIRIDCIHASNKTRWVDVRCGDKLVGKLNILPNDSLIDLGDVKFVKLTFEGKYINNGIEYIFNDNDDHQVRYSITEQDVQTNTSKLVNYFPKMLHATTLNFLAKHAATSKNLLNQCFVKYNPLYDETRKNNKVTKISVDDEIIINLEVNTLSVILGQNGSRSTFKDPTNIISDIITLLKNEIVIHFEMVGNSAPVISFPESRQDNKHPLKELVELAGFSNKENPLDTTIVLFPHLISFYSGTQANPGTHTGGAGFNVSETFLICVSKHVDTIVGAEVLAHEIGHRLSLEHPWVDNAKNKLTYNQGETDNVMDYPGKVSEKEHFWKWQVDQMQIGKEKIIEKWEYERKNNPTS